MRARIALTPLVALVVVALVSFAAPAAASAPKPIASLSGPISNEKTITYWAYPAQAAAVHLHARLHSRTIDRLHFRTEDGFPEVYLVLAQVVYPHETWFEIRLPGRPNGRTGWVREQALGVLHVNHDHVVVDERGLRLTFYSHGRRIFSAPVGIGKPSTPTPTGNFWIREKMGPLPSSNPYYPYAFGTADYSTLTEWPKGGIVGIHGPFGAASWEIPGRISHGCIRLHIADVWWLGRHVPVGTPLTVVYY